jgi:hypothetical protein
LFFALFFSFFFALFHLKACLVKNQKQSKIINSS